MAANNDDFDPLKDWPAVRITMPYTTVKDDGWYIAPGIGLHSFPKRVSRRRERLAAWLIKLAHRIDPWSAVG